MSTALALYSGKYWREGNLCRILRSVTKKQFSFRPVLVRVERLLSSPVRESLTRLRNKYSVAVSAFIIPKACLIRLELP